MSVSIVAASKANHHHNGKKQGCLYIGVQPEYLEQFKKNLKNYAHHIASLAEPSRTDEILNKNISWVDQYYQTIEELLQKISPYI